MFESIYDDAIVFHPIARKRIEPAKALGDALDPNSGYNLFVDVEGYAINNLRAEPVQAQQCYWEGVTDSETILRDLVNGPADVSQPLAKAVIPAAVYCSVRDTETLAPLATASVQLDTLDPVAGNADGVCVFACINEGTHTVAVCAAGYEPDTQVVVVAEAEQLVLPFPLKKQEPVEGEGEGPAPDGCMGGVSRPPGPAGRHNILLLAAIGVVLLLATVRRRASARADVS